MSDAQPGAVPRTPEDPSPNDVHDAMTPREPYTAGELATLFDDTSRWTIQRRLETLHDQDRVRRKKHGEQRVSWWRDD